MSALRPRLRPTQARVSMRVLEYALRGSTANARQPNGRESGVRRASCAVEYIYGVRDGVIPKRGWRPAGDHRRAR
eukprot:5819734-Pleurochrysis_carterae.AAC.2